MKLRLIACSAFLAIPVLISGCQTVSDQAPLEVKAAQSSLKKARAADVEDYMPSAMEAAQRKFDKSVDLLDKNSARNEAIENANESKKISDNAVKLVEDMHAYDRNSGSYLSVSERGAKADALQQQLAQANARISELEGQYSASVDENKKLASRPPEETIPADFRVGKPLAYFSSGSTVLAQRYRSDIDEVAAMLKKNKDLEVTLEGFADPRGSAKLNERLAQQRIEAVANELKAQGVPASQMKLVTIGATDDRSTARHAGHGELQLDRRVTATISKVAH